MLIHCTAKLQKEMKLSKYSLSEISNAPLGSLGGWYAHLFYVLRHKCVIFTNAKALFSFVCFGVRREKIKDLSGTFRKGWQKHCTTRIFPALILVGFLTSVRISATLKPLIEAFSAR